MSQTLQKRYAIYLDYLKTDPINEGWNLFLIQENKDGYITTSMEDNIISDTFEGPYESFDKAYESLLHNPLFLDLLDASFTMLNESPFSFLIKSKGISAYRLSKSTGIAETTLSSYVRGETAVLKMNLEYAALIAKGLDMSLDALYAALNQKDIT